MSPPARRLSGLARFLRTPTLGRSVVGLLAAAIAVLLAVNVLTQVMIYQTAVFNDRVERLQETRRAARTVLIVMANAETAQRGFLLTGRADFLTPYYGARAGIETSLGTLRAAGDDPATAAAAQRLARLTGDKFAGMNSTLALVSAGDGPGAVAAVRAGRGETLMSDIRAEVAAIDDRLSGDLSRLTRRSELYSRSTGLVNVFGAAVVLMVAGVAFLLVRRYVSDLNQARDALDATNAGLEDTVRSRTAALTRANEEVQRFAYIVSHDLRSPLVNVMGYTAELEQAGKVVDRAIARVEAERPVDPAVIAAVREDMPEAVGFIRASTQKMDRLINAILKLSREGRRGLMVETLDMTALVQAIADTVSHQVAEADGSIVVETLPTLDSDRLSMDQILGNLIDNAVKYRQPDRPLSIVVSGADLPGGWVEYAVADNGRGVAARDHERIFELFRRAGRQDQPGEGLGLAFVRNSVRRLGGTIDLASEAGEGSTFRLKFPKRLILEDAGDAV